MDSLVSTRRAGGTIAALLLALLSCAVPFASYSQALTIAQALELARDNNPQYLGAQAKIAAARARHAQAIAQTRPQLTASATQNWNHRHYDTLQPLFPTDTEISNYQSRSQQLQLSQPLYRRANIMAMLQTRAEVDQSEYELLATEQELLLKLAENWMNVSVTQDSLEFYDAQVAATQRELDQFMKASQLDLAASPELEQADAKYQQAVADQAAGAFEMQEKIAALEEVVGPIEGLAVPMLLASVPVQAPQYSGFQALLERAENESPAVLAAEEALRAATKEIGKQRAGHEPTIDIVGSMGRNRQDSGNFPGQSGYDITQRSIGLQVTVPLYSSGLQRARVNEAIAMKRKAAEELEAAMRTARTNARLAWFRYHANQLKAKASAQTVRSYQIAWRTAASGAANGLKFDVDVLRARQDYLQAVRDEHKTQAEMLLDSLRLKAVVGTLTDADIVALDAHMQPRIASAP